MLLIAGLGNPGAKHAGNRHNIGFMAADAIAGRHGFGPWREKFSAQVAEGMLGGEKALIMKPQTYMNRSGQAVGDAMRFYKLTADDLVVLYDELDLPPGKLRLKTGGGSGGHNGIRSIEAHCGREFRRIRLGIGRPDNKDKVSAYVLSDFARADSEWLDALLATVSENMPLLAEDRDDAFMNHVAISMQKNSAKPADAQKKPKQQAGQERHGAKSPSGTSGGTERTGPMAGMLRRLFGGGES